MKEQDTPHPWLKGQDTPPWLEVPVREGLRPDFVREWWCPFCNCEKMLSRAGILQHWREGIMYGAKEPSCFGPVPINEQTID
jgi:hypothetical protein